MSQEVFAASGISSAVANDPDDGDTVYSVGDTITITFPAATNATSGGSMSNAEFRANFTIATTDIDTADTVTGTWSSTSVLLLTIGAIGGADPPTINTDTVSYDVTNGNLRYLANATEFLGTARTLTGDFGLTISASASSNDGGGRGCNGDCEEPTLGIDERGTRIVENGFTYNGNPIDVERYFTPYPLVTVQTGKQNIAEFKIYDNMGPESISHFELAFGLASGQSIGMSKAVINWDKSWDGTEIITLNDPENVLDRIKVYTSEGKCSDELQQKCLLVRIEHTFRAPLDFNILGTNVWDVKRNAWQNYYNHGVEVVGDSLNPPQVFTGIHKGQIYSLIETSKTTAIDKFDNSWSFSYGKWVKDYVPNRGSPDKVAMNGITRDNSMFNEYKIGQALIAEHKLSSLCSECLDTEFEEINNIHEYRFLDISDSLKDIEVQKKMKIESEKAAKTLSYLLDSKLHLKESYFKN